MWSRRTLSPAITSGGDKTTKLAPGGISDLGPYKLMAVIGEQVIHLGGRASTAVLLGRAQITASDRVLDVGCGVPAYTRKMAWPMPGMAKAVPCLGYIVIAGTKPA